MQLKTGIVSILLVCAPLIAFSEEPQSVNSNDQVPGEVQEQRESVETEQSNIETPVSADEGLTVDTRLDEEQTTSQSNDDVSGYDQSLQDSQSWLTSNLKWGAEMIVAMAGLAALLFVLRQNFLANATSSMSAKAASEANELSARTMRESLRPWLAIEVAPTTDFIWGPTGARIGLCVTVKNTGQSPALRADIEADLVVMKEGNVIHRFRNSCEALETPKYETVGKDIFPGETLDVDRICMVTRSEVLEGVAHYKDKLVDDLDSDEIEKGAFSMCLYLCVTYQSIYTIGTSQTAFMSLVEKLTPDGFGRRTMFFVDETIPDTRMLITRHEVDAGRIS